MKKEKKYHGVIVPMITPFTQEGKIDESATARVVEYLLNEGAYLFLLGTTGESASMPLEEQLKFVKYVLDHIKEKTIVYVGISNDCLKNSIDLANQYSEWGADVFVAHLPAYYPLTPDHMLNYYESLANSSPRPVLIYNIPATTDMSIPLDVIEKLSYHPNIAGLKDSEKDMDRLKFVAKLFAEREDFSVLSGWTTRSADALLYGCDGIVPNTGNIVPGMFKKLYDAVLDGDNKTAEELQKKINDIAEIHQIGFPISVSIARLKLLMSEIGLCDPWVLPPLLTRSSQEKEEIKERILNIGINKHE